jgi:hypothetical protein
MNGAPFEVEMVIHHQCKSQRITAFLASTTLAVILPRDPLTVLRQPATPVVRKLNTIAV